MKTIRLFSISLLVLIGGAAAAGGASLLWDPSGSQIGLPLSLLEGTPFTNYFIPGLLLFVTIGLTSLVTAVLALLRNAFSARLTVLEGAIIAGWIIIQVVIIHTVTPIQVIVGGLGFVLFCLGLFQQEEESASEANRYAD